MRTLTTVVAFLGLVALVLTTSASPVQEPLPEVPAVAVITSSPETIDSEVVELQNWNSTALAAPPKPTVTRRR